MLSDELETLRQSGDASSEIVPLIFLGDSDLEIPTTAFKRKMFSYCFEDMQLVADYNPQQRKLVFASTRRLGSFIK